MSTKIDYSKPVETVNGEPVRILCTDGPGDRPVVGILGNAIVRWEIGGAKCPFSKTDLDLRQVLETLERWVVFYDDGLADTFCKKPPTGRHLLGAPIAIHHVKFKKGDGL